MNLGDGDGPRSKGRGAPLPGPMNPTLLGYLLVFLGGGIGAGLRHAINRAMPFAVGGTFPAATMLINITGSLVMGLLAGWFAFRGPIGGQHLRLFLTTGILGGYTTFSTFSLDVALLWERGNVIGTAAYLLGSVALSLLGIFGGLAVIRYLAA